MCSSNVNPPARQAMADLLRDMAEALDPEHPEDVQIGPVDFGPRSITPDERCKAVAKAITNTPGNVRMPRRRLAAVGWFRRPFDRCRFGHRILSKQGWDLCRKHGLESESVR